jgi:hypothetical protein
MGMLGGSVLGGEGRRVAEGYAPYLGVGYCREGGLLGEKGFEGLPRGVRGDALACRGHPYMFFNTTSYNKVKIEEYVPFGCILFNDCSTQNSTQNTHPKNFLLLNF